MPDAADWLVGGGEMGRLIRSTDWSGTSLGPIAQWPQSLRIALGICLHSRFPMHLCWGSDLSYFYNDAHVPILGSRHPAALGASTQAIWSEIWPIIGPQIEAAMSSGESTWNERVRVVMSRHGHAEETWFTWSYSPVRDASGAIAGLFCAAFEETPRVLAERQQDLLMLGALEQQRRTTDAIFSTIVDFTYLFDLEGRLRFVNKPLLDLWGLTLEQAVGKNFFDLKYPDELAAKLQRQIQQVIDTKSRLVDETEYTSPAGAIGYYEYIFAPVLAADGTAQAVAGSTRTITDRKQHEAERERLLRAIETERAKLADVFQRSASFMTVLRGPTHVFELANERCYQLVGRREVIGKSIREALPEVEGQGFFELLDRVYATGEPFAAKEMRIMLQRQPGQPLEERFLEFVYQPTRDPDGAITGIFAHGIDLTESKRAEASLREMAVDLERQSRLFERIASATPDFIYVFDIDGRLLYANRRLLEVWGKTFEGAVGKTFSELGYPQWHADMHLREFRQVIETKQPIKGEVPFTGGSGISGVYEYIFTPVPGPDGEVQVIAGTTRDITDRKRASERISRLYAVAAALSEASTPEDVARVTVHQGIAAVGANAGSLALLSEDGARLELAGSVGYTPEGIARWQQFPLDAPIPLAEAVRLGKPVYIESPEERIRRYPALASVNAPKGTQASACLPLAIGGRTVGVLGLSFERPGGFSPGDREFMLSLGRQCAQALERARLFEAERRARAEAERASMMKDEFLATLSHELRTPLNAILGWSQILNSGGTRDEEDLAEGLRTIERNARAQTQIIEDLLDMSRIISGKVRLDVQRVELSPVVQAAVGTVKPAADAKGVRIQSVLDPLAGPISGDPNRMHQVLWNLLANAVKFTPRGGRVQVLLERVNSHVEVSVIDTGEGIKPEFLPHVFERFRQADATTTRRHGGLGLGLAIVKQLVELHGGSVRAKSPGQGQGATFTVSLPMMVVHAEPEASPERRHPSAANTPVAAEPCADIAGIKVLVVDDEPDARALLKRVLEACDARVIVAGSASEAVALVQSERPDVIASDIGMPGEDGYSLIRRVRALGSSHGGDTPAVALTAYARAEDRVKVVMAGFQHHIAKPVEPAELIAMIASLMRRTT